MAYSNNPNLPKARGNAVYEVIKEGRSPLVIARKFGIHRSTLSRWIKKWRESNWISLENNNCPNRPVGESRFTRCTWRVETLCSAPSNHPNAINDAIVSFVLELRNKLKRCAEVVLYRLKQSGIQICLSTVKRIFKRNHVYDRKKNEQRPYRRNLKRPIVTQPGGLVQIDTVHLVNPLNGSKQYVFTVIDLHTRMAHARVFERLSQAGALATVLEAEQLFGFRFNVIQADNGPEFDKWFKSRLEANNSRTIRHSRPRRPNDNAHIERFNRTLREECIGAYSAKATKQIQTDLKGYIAGLPCGQSPLENA